MNGDRGSLPTSARPQPAATAASPVRSQSSELVSSEVADLMRLAARTVLDDPTALLAQVDEAVIAVNRKLLAIDPGLLDPLRAAARSNVTHWAIANIRAPGQPVAPNVDRGNTDFARQVVRHGFDETILAGFRAAQNVVVTHVTDLACELDVDRSTLHELLRTTTGSIFDFVDSTLAALGALIADERSRQRPGTARRETVDLLLAGAPVSLARATEQLGYPVDRRHVAGVLWRDTTPSERLAAGPGDEALVHALVSSTGATQKLLLPLSATVTWFWIVVSAERIEETAPSVNLPPGVFISLGRPASGVAGFRSSHLEAVDVQQHVHRTCRAQQVTTYDEVELVLLAGSDEARARAFVRATLGELVTAPPEILETLRAFIRADANTSRAARSSFTHRNTVIARMDKVRDLLPIPLEGNAVKVGLALELAVLLP